MTDIATGGKVWILPDDTQSSTGATPSTPQKKRKFDRDYASGPTMLFGFLIPLGLLPTLAYVFLHPQMVEDDAARTPITNVADGYQSLGLLWSQATMTLVMVYACALVAVLVCVGVFVRALGNVTQRWGVSIGLSFVLLFILPSTLPIIMPTSDFKESFSSWATEKYQLSELESYNTGKTVLAAKKESGEDVKMNVFVKDDFIYLYETNADLAEILAKLDGASTK